MKIVIIEDEVDLSALMRNFLVKQLKIKSPDISVSIAHTITEGLNFINTIHPDLVFLDNNLPDGKGINEIEDIRLNSQYYSSIKIVMMSAMTNIKEEALQKGADFFLDKPISFKEVSRIINTI
tara:strand:+ start:296 stop:664 length:369 start_codon:yes stop_codon:yes gene_type:complete